MIKDNAYRLIEKDISVGRLSHAYLAVCKDENLSSYLKKYAKLILCEQKNACGKCRTCTLIDKNLLPDCKITDKSSITVEDVQSLAEEAYYKPIEKDVKLFLISDFSYANEKAQNKLLKLLEEPPNGVTFLIACSEEAQVLPTIKSRVKKAEITPLDEKTLFNELIGEFPDEGKLSRAIKTGGGYIERTKRAYRSEGVETNVCLDVLLNLKKSSSLPEFSSKIGKDVKSVIGIAELIFGDVLKYHGNINSYEFFTQGDERLEKIASEYNLGATVEILERLNTLNKKLYYNANANMIADNFLFTLLEVKYKWQK